MWRILASLQMSVKASQQRKQDPPDRNRTGFVFWRMVLQLDWVG